MSSERRGTARTYGEARITDAAIVLVEPGPLKRFTRRVQRAGVLRELKLREHFRPPSARRRAKSLRARKRDAKAAARRSQAFTPQSAANEKRWAE